jgi:hypothetical protein
MATVKRDSNGEITHVKVDNLFFKKEDANKILWGDITEKELNEYFKDKGNPKLELLGLINEHETLHSLKTRILKQLGKIGNPE